MADDGVLQSFWGDARVFQGGAGNEIELGVVRGLGGGGGDGGVVRFEVVPHPGDGVGGQFEEALEKVAHHGLFLDITHIHFEVTIEGIDFETKRI